jgi:hypothetical protein
MDPQKPPLLGPCLMCWAGPLQVERYKQLLLKQRDIMIALTQRLTERDEQILSLQSEIEAYDSHQRCVTSRGLAAACPRPFARAATAKGEECFCS